MKKSKLIQLIKESLKNRSKKDSCNCGCHSCENVGNPGVVLNESLIKNPKISTMMQYHIDNKLPLTENTFRYGSYTFLNLWDEARTLYVREVIHVNDLDKEILEETDLGNYGMYEGQKVPLDLPMLDEELIITNGKKRLAIDSEDLEKLKSGKDIVGKSLEYTGQEEWISSKDNWEVEKSLEETDKKKNPPLGKPKRGGSKAYYVYVKDPKTKKVKKISFGSGGLKAKINNPKARQAFAKRHNCAKKTDKTTAGYWSCRLPRYAKALGIKSSFSGYW